MNCIHKHINGSFTLTQEKKCIKEIKDFLDNQDELRNFNEDNQKRDIKVRKCIKDICDNLNQMLEEI